MQIKRMLEDIGGGTLWVLTAVTWAENVKVICQIISLVLSIVISLLIIGAKVIGWWKKAKADGKITKDEIDELGHIMNEGVNDIKEHLDSGEESKKGEK